MVNLKDFEEAGYSVTLCEDSSPFEANWAEYLCQKKIGTKYFINVYRSDVRLWDVNYIWPKDFNPISYTIKVQFTRGLLTYDITVSHSREFNSVRDIELIVEEIWCNLDMDYYEA